MKDGCNFLPVGGGLNTSLRVCNPRINVLLPLKQTTNNNKLKKLFCTNHGEHRPLSWVEDIGLHYRKNLELRYL